MRSAAIRLRAALRHLALASVVAFGLLSIIATDGDEDEVGTLGFRFVPGLAFDPNTNTLYGSDILTLLLIIIDQATGLGTPVP